MNSHPVIRFDLGSSHGWYIGSQSTWGLLPGDEDVWRDQWLRHSETAGIGIDDLAFRDDAQRLEYLRDVGL